VVTRRKYRSSAPVAADEPVAAAPASPDAPGPATDADTGNPLQRAHDALQHAEQLQQQHRHRQQIGLPEPQLDAQQRAMVDQHIDGLSVSDHWKRFLRSHPSLLMPPYHASMMHQYDIALRAGVPDNSVHMDHAVLLGVARDLEHHHHLKQLTSADRPTPQNAAMHADVDQHVAALQAEAERHMTEQHRPAPTAPRLPPAKRTMPMSAPPSRDYPGVSGRSHDSNTLTAAEREIARNSFGDPNMSNHEKELLYLRNRNKYRQAKADGSYSDQGRG
jgi:hypothetical protein